MNHNFSCFYRGVKHEGPYDLYTAPNIIPVIKSIRIETGGACSRDGSGELRTGF
jgi:hypothetical protein